MISLNIKNERSTGFTLLELLIVIAIIAILSIALVFMLNPAETLKKARDAQRISDLKSVKTALGIMLTASSTPSLDNFGAVCNTSTTWGGVTTQLSPARIAYSIDSATAPTLAAGTYTAGGDAASTYTTASPYVRTGSVGKIDGTGWIPVSLKGLTSGTPISNFPVDPINTISGSNATSTDLTYRYACQNATTATVGAGKPSYIFEIDARLESNAYTVEENKMTKDGGDNDNYFEQGNSLNLLPTTGNF